MALSGPKTYYVSGKGRDSNNGTTPETPFRTLQKAANLTSPGDTVLVMKGVYANPWPDSSVLEINRSGNALAYITYRNFPGHHPKILVAAHNWQGIAIRASYIIVRGFEVAGNALNLTYEEAWRERFTDSPKTNAFGIAIAKWPNYETLRNVVVRNNYVHHMPAAGIATIATDYITISQNMVRSCAWWTKYGSSGIALYSSRNVDQNITSYRNIIMRNICHDNENFIPFQEAGTITDGNGIIIDDNKNTQHPGVPAYTGRTLVCNNLCFNNGGTGAHSYSSANVDFVNNIAYFNNRSLALDSGEIIANESTNVRFHNNISYARAGKSAQKEWRNVNITSRNNTYFNGSVASPGNNSLYADPKFINPTTDPEACNFRSMTGSPSRGTGTMLLAPKLDLDGNLRPTALIDRGSYQA